MVRTAVDPLAERFDDVERVRDRDAGCTPQAIDDVVEASGCHRFAQRCARASAGVGWARISAAASNRIVEDSVARADASCRRPARRRSPRRCHRAAERISRPPPHRERERIFELSGGHPLALNYDHQSPAACIRRRGRGHVQRRRSRPRGESTGSTPPSGTVEDDVDLVRLSHSSPARAGHSAPRVDASLGVTSGVAQRHDASRLPVPSGARPAVGRSSTTASVRFSSSALASSPRWGATRAIHRARRRCAAVDAAGPNTLMSSTTVRGPADSATVLPSPTR